jgi:tetratricopeptide (TPR) repeat protein
MLKHTRYIFVLALPLVAGRLGAQSLQYRSAAGKEYRAEVDTGPVARAQAALKADPKNIDKIVALGTAQAGARQMKEAVATFSAGLALYPNNALLLRWRGHRHLSVREFAQAKADLTRGSQLDSTIYGNWYHLGVVKFVEGDFNGAADAFTHALPKAPDPGELAGSTDWLWMSLSRAGKRAEAKAMLARRPDTLPTTPGYAYVIRLKMYRGELAPTALFTPADTADVQVATLSFGLGNWYMVQGDSAKAKTAFQRAIKSGGWPGFGFIVAEAELARMGK